MASGVKVSDKCHEIFKEVKMKTKGSKKRLFVVYKISEDCCEIIPDDEFDEKEEIQDFDQLLTALPKADGRYVIFDYKYPCKSGIDNSKLILVSWVPERVSIKKKMLYASSKDSLKNMMHEDLPLFMCDSPDDLKREDILAKLLK